MQTFFQTMRALQDIGGTIPICGMQKCRFEKNFHTTVLCTNNHFFATVKVTYSNSHRHMPDNAEEMDLIQVLTPQFSYRQVF